MSIALFSRVTSEFDLRLQVQQEFFAEYACTIEDNRIDFIVSTAKDQLYQQPLLWAESKLHNISLDTMFAQLLLTVRPLLKSGEILPPKFLGVFNKNQISFIEYHHILDIFNLNDLNWNERPSGVSQKTVNTMAPYLTAKMTFQFDTETAELKKFITKNFIAENTNTIKLKVNKNNFIAIYNKWVKDVYPSIKLPDGIEKSGILSKDFFLADLISDHNTTIVDNLKIVLDKTQYKLKVKLDKRYLYDFIDFSDHMKAHQAFWARYQRPPKKEYYEYILNRHDLLVPQNIRELTGAFFTPKIWVEKAHEYLAKTLGENWQDEYYIWDCCAGTCNLLANLTNKDKIWASTLEDQDVNIVHTIIDEGNLNLWKPHVFQFDFLNDDFSKLPLELQDILRDETRRKKLIILINPPYADSGNTKTLTGSGQNKKGIANTTKAYSTYGKALGKARTEIFALFLMRIKQEIPNCILAQFSTLKTLKAPNFKQFRSLFNSKLEHLFLAPANTFDNVNGKFPIGFFIWDTKQPFQNTDIQADVFDSKGNFAGIKNIHISEDKLIGQWLTQYKDSSTLKLGMLNSGRNDFQNQNLCYIKNDINDTAHALTLTNIQYACIFFAVRHCFAHTWLNHDDRFFYPFCTSKMINTTMALYRDTHSIDTAESFLYEQDIDFKNNCIIFTLFHEKNAIQSAGQPNHWIPFSPAEVHAKNTFRSTFMYDYLKQRGPLTPAAQAVLDAGRALWTYYHETIAHDDNAHVDASLYEIREYFKGRNEKGHMNTKATDEYFNKLDTHLRHTVKALAIQIQPKVYEYGFLKD